MRGHRLSLHTGTKPGDPLPALSVVEPLLERQEVAGGHWYWLGDFTRDREAVLPWRAPDDRLCHYAVPRLLLQLWGDFPSRAGVLNLCGLVSCANPSHWVTETPRERGLKTRPVVLTDFHGRGWTNGTRTETCLICYQKPNRPCDPAYHDAEFRRRTQAEATACPICYAAPYQDCDSSVHRLVFQHQMRLKKGEL